MEKTMAVYDVEPRYVDRSADVINQKEKTLFQVVALMGLEALKGYAREHTIEILLIGSAVPKELVREVLVGQVVVLADGEVVPVFKEYLSVYKYQPTDSIIREVLAHRCEQPKAAEYVIAGTRAKILGVYPPTGRCLKASLSWTLGQQLGKNGKALLVSMEEYSGFSRLVGEEIQPDLADVPYFYCQGNYSFAQLSSTIYIWGNLDYIPPVCYPEDLGQIAGEEMAEFLARTANESSYETLVMDTGNMGRHVIPVTDVCDTVYVPVKDDCVSAAKLEEFEAHLGTSGKRELLEKIQGVKSSYHSGLGRGDTYLEQPVWGELGDYVRQLLKGK